MANKKDKANDPQEEKKVKSSKSTKSNKGDLKKVISTKEIEFTSPKVLALKKSRSSSNTAKDEILPEEKMAGNSEKKSENVGEKTEEFNKMNFNDLVEILQKKIRAEQWFTNEKNIKEIILIYENKFKSDIKTKKHAFINEGGNEIDFYFKPQHKNIFDQLVREFKKNRRTYFQEREQSQKINLDRKLEIIEKLKELINIDENINVTYKKFKHLQESWHKTGHVPRAQSNNIWHRRPR